ncbi:DUF177 domain-containing protein [Candidatus Zixiibacteriota bacterium]
MKIIIKGLSSGAQKQSYQESAAALGFDEERFHFTRPISARFTLQKVGQQIVCRGQVSSTVELECSRCLEPLEQDISEEMTLLFSFLAAEPGDAADEELKIIPPGADQVDVTEEVRQTLLLAMPTKPLCNIQCQGLCPRCGADRNREGCNCPRPDGDPRWKNLQKLLFNESKGEPSGSS